MRNGSSQDSQECCIPSSNSEICTCQADEVLGVISKKWALITVRAIGAKRRIGYNGLMKTLGNVSPTTLSTTLKELERSGLVSRKVVDTAPIRVDYSLTREGQELSGLITPLLEWASLRRGRMFMQMKSR